MANRYFVGDTDSDWNDASNWASASGGAGGAGIPGSADVAIFDVNSPACVIDSPPATISALDLQSGFASTLNTSGFNLTVTNAVTATAGTLTGNGAETWNFGGLSVGGGTVSLPALGGTLDVGNTGFDMSSGSVTLGSSTITISGPVSVTGGTINKGTSTIDLDPSASRAWDFNGETLNNLSVSLGSAGLTGDFSGAVVVDGTFDISGWGNLNKFLGTVTAKGDVIAAPLAMNTDTTGKIIINGSLSQDIYADKAGAVGYVPGIEINSSGGTVTFFDDIHSFGSGGWTYVAGTVDMGTSRISIGSSGAYTLDSAGMSFYDFRNLKGGGHLLTSVGNNVVNNDLILDGTGLRMDGGVLQVAGDIITENGTTVNQDSTTVIEINGGGAQELYVDKAGGSGETIALKINKGGGTLTIYDTIKIGGRTDTLTWVAGTVDALTNTPTVIMIQAGTAQTITPGPVDWYNVELADGGHTTVIVGTFKVTNDFTLSAGFVHNGGTIEVGGDFVSTAPAINSGTLAIILNGTGAQNIDVGPNTLPDGDFTVNKASGTASLIADFAPTGGWAGDLLLVQGTLDLAGFDVNIVARTFDIDAGLRLKGDETITATVDLDVATSSVEFYDNAVTAVLSNLGELVFFNLTLGDAGGAKTHNFAAGSDYVVNGAFAANGTTGAKTLLRSTTPGTRFGLALSVNTYLLDVLDVKDCNAADGEFLYAIGSTDSGNNAGIIFLVTTRPVELTLIGASFDAAKVEYRPNTASRICRLIPQVVESEDFAGDALPSGWAEVDTGGNVNFQNGRMEIVGNNTQHANGVYTSQRVLKPAKVTYELYYPNADVSGANGKHQTGFADAPLSSPSVAQTFYPSGDDAGSWCAGVQASSRDLLEEQITYTIRHYYAYDCAGGIGSYKVTIEGGNYAVETLVSEIAINPAQIPANIYIEWSTWKISMEYYIDNVIWANGYPTDDPVITLIDADGGDATSVWSMDSIRFLEDVAGLTFSYAEGDTPNPTNWSLFMTLANLRLESDPTARYFKLRTKVSSDGATQREPSQGYILMDVSGGNGGGRRPYVRRHSA